MVCRTCRSGGKPPGHAVIAAAPAELNGHRRVGTGAAELSLMREIKRRFDPQEILNPGRFVAAL